MSYSAAIFNLVPMETKLEFFYYLLAGLYQNLLFRVSEPVEIGTSGIAANTEEIFATKSFLPPSNLAANMADIFDDILDRLLLGPYI